MPKRNHAAEVTALLSVVQQSISELEGMGVALGKPTREALTVVERWVKGEAVTAAELDAARAAAHGEPKKGQNGGADRALTWANAAVGNLAFVASKARGWQNGERSVMDAAVYTISSLRTEEPGIPERFEAVRIEALDRALASGKLPKAPKVVAPAGKPRRIKGELAPHIGAMPSARLVKLSAIFDPAKRGDDDALRALLLASKFPAHESVLAFERRYGGLIMPEAPGSEGMDFWFGAFACLRGHGHEPSPEGEGLAQDTDMRALVPVVRSPNDIVYFLGGDGAAWAQDTLEDPAPMLFARDGDRMVARIVIFQLVFERRFTGTLEELEGKRGEEAAAARGLPLVAEASDDLARVWANDRTVVVEVQRTTDQPWKTLIASAARRGATSLTTGAPGPLRASILSPRSPRPGSC